MIASIFISPTKDPRIEKINKILNTLGIKKGHPDLLYFPSGEKLGIESAREIKKHLSTKPFQAKGKVVILEDASNFSIEAQNALLKTLEEPPENAVLILGTNSDAKLLPTILSRCRIIKIQDTPLHQACLPARQGSTGQAGNIEELLTLTVEERFEYVEKNKDRELLLKLIIQYFHQNLALYSKKTDISFLKKLLKAEKWSSQNVNIRAILEYLMLVMPQKL